MAAFPDIDYDEGRTIVPDIDGRIIDLAYNGRGRGRNYYNRWFYGTIPHLLISTTDRNSIWTFVDANYEIEFEWNDRVTTEQYTNCIFLARPEEARRGAFWDMIVRWRGYLPPP